jgi:hypothetical protein
MNKAKPLKAIVNFHSKLFASKFIASTDFSVVSPQLLLEPQAMKRTNFSVPKCICLNYGFQLKQQMEKI